LLVAFAIDFLSFDFVLHGFVFDGFFSDVVGLGDVFEGIFDVEHGGVIHVDKRVKYFLLVFEVIWPFGEFVVSGREKQRLALHHLKDIKILPLFWLHFFIFVECVQLKILKLEIEFILHKITNSFGIDFVEFADERGGDESMFESESDIFDIAEDELVEIVENEF
jgi:hypothetical protein